MADLTESILEYLEKNNSVDSIQLSSFFKEDHQKIVGAVKSLQSLGNVITSEQRNNKHWQLTEEGKEVAEKGSHEALVFYAVPKNGILQSELMKTIPSGKIGFSKAMSAGWIYTDKSNEDGPLVKKKVSDIEDVVQQSLKKILVNESDGITDAQKQEFKKRKLLQEITVKSYFISKGPEFSTSFLKLETDLTSDMIAKQSWKEKTFKPYNFSALGVNPSCGYFHPLMKVRAEFRQIFLEMGFTEMPTNNFIESSFWNFDALFQPQQHPARDAHDTFFISDPQCATEFPEDYLQKVKTVHQTGGYGSQGYQYEWKLEEAKKNLLRTHTTSNSARMLYCLAQQEKFHPVKYFSIDRVFRNETLDATHLAEFHQIEGVIADYNLGLGHLIGVLYEFFKKLGITKLRFKPAYNPYTEPSMEIFSYHEGLQKWVEVGNSGVFRPEMLLPMGLSKDVQVIAWGLSLERPTMIKYGINNIRDLVGQKVNLQMVQENPICRLDKNSSLSSDDNKLQKRLNNLEIRQERILSKLESMQIEIGNFEREHLNKKFDEVHAVTEKQSVLQNGFICLKDQKTPDDSDKASSSYVEALQGETSSLKPDDSISSIIIYCNPRQPMWSILAIHQLLSECMPIEVITKKDSNVHSLDSYLDDFFSVNEITPTKVLPQIKLYLIWKDIGNDPIMMIDKTSIFGEVNIIRYFGRLIHPTYDEDPILSTIIDDWLDKIHVTVLNGNNKDRAAMLKSLNEHLEKNIWLVNNTYSIADLAMWSALCQTQAVESALAAVSNWLKACTLIPSISAAALLIDKYY